MHITHNKERDENVRDAIRNGEIAVAQVPAPVCRVCGASDRALGLRSDGRCWACFWAEVDAQESRAHRETTTPPKSIQ